MRILIIEDDVELAAAIAEYLSFHGAECDFAYSGTSGLELASESLFDVIILDVMLPGMRGFAVCTELRQQGKRTPVLMLTASDRDVDQLEGFQSGIDDYVIKPCPMPLLWARLQALHRRQQPHSDTLSVGPLTLYLTEHRATRDGQELKLTPTGWKLLELLAKRSPDVVSRGELEGYAWEGREVGVGNFNVQLSQLRKTVDRPFASPLVHTLVGLGLALREKRDG